MPEWLLKEEKYIPQIDKDTFINKSILSLLNLISRIKAQEVHKENKFNVNAVLKVAFTFVMIVLLSITKSVAFVVIINIYLLLILGSMKAEVIIKVLKVSFIVALFTFIILLPAVFMGNYYSIMMLTPKVFATVMAVNMLSYSTSFRQVTNALKFFFIPDIFIFVLDITLKYIVLLGEFTLNMLYALKCRSVGRNRSKYISISGIAGIMFIKSKEMAEDMYAAMECRGFTGEYHIKRKFVFSFHDIIYTAFNAILFYIFIVLGR
jgi:ABC-type cobalt transport system, permease component CbiQ and related transporters